MVNIENKFLPQEYRVKCGGWDGGFGLECQFLTLMKLTYQILASYYAQKRLKSNCGWWVGGGVESKISVQLSPKLNNCLKAFLAAKQA